MKNLDISMESSVFMKTIAVIDTLPSPEPNFVVSRQVDGSALSYYKDLVWDWTTYIANGKSHGLNFRFWPLSSSPTSNDILMLEEMKSLMYLIIWRRKGPTLSYQTLLHYLKLLRKLCQYFSIQNISLKQVLSCKNLLIEATRAVPPYTVRTLNSLLTTLGKIGPAEIGFKVLGNHASNALKSISDDYISTLRQHPPIPTRIYSLIIKKLIDEITDFENISERFFDLTRLCIGNHFLGRSKGRQWACAKENGICPSNYEDDFPELLTKFELVDYFKIKHLSTGMKNPSVKSLSAGLTRLQKVCRLTIQVFSGMRDIETGLLPFDCLQTINQDGKLHYFLVGVTTKMNNGLPKNAKWVTCYEGSRAVALAKRIAELCFEVTSHTRKENSKIYRLPLFPSVGYLGFAGNTTAPKEGRLLTSKFDLSKNSNFRTILEPPIIESDILELERIDPHRAWRTEDNFRVGHKWALTTHQLRRSLALYAQRSGLVSLPTLRRQLQHLTEEMARYYAKGSVFADNIIANDKNHFGNEWRDMQPISAALTYMQDITKTDDKLFGAHIEWVEKKLRGDDGKIQLDREATIKRFKNGELSYKETPVGGCTFVGQCEVQPIKWLHIECIKGCKNMVGRLSKLERVISAQTRLVERLTPGSIEYRSESADLQILLDAKMDFCS